MITPIRIKNQERKEENLICFQRRCGGIRESTEIGCISFNDIK